MSSPDEFLIVKESLYNSAAAASGPLLLFTPSDKSGTAAWLFMTAAGSSGVKFTRLAFCARCCMDAAAVLFGNAEGEVTGMTSKIFASTQ
jgi:hypothetical protein